MTETVIRPPFLSKGREVVNYIVLAHGAGMRVPDEVYDHLQSIASEEFSGEAVYGYLRKMYGEHAIIMFATFLHLKKTFLVSLFGDGQDSEVFGFVSSIKRLISQSGYSIEDAEVNVFNGMKIYPMKPEWLKRLRVIMSQ